MFPRNRKELASKKRKQLMREIEEKIGKLKKGEITSSIGSKSEQYYLGKEGKILFFRLQEKLFPSLWFLRAVGIVDLVIPTISVDKGATPHLLNGADLFVGGITKFDPFEPDNVIIALNPSDFPICVGITLVSSDEIETIKKGKILKNYHWIGDKIWNFKY
ncbi:MAG: PUA domain-containing protein [Promethearchaeota archaeon]